MRCVSPFSSYSFLSERRGFFSRNFSPLRRPRTRRRRRECAERARVLAIPHLVTSSDAIEGVASALASMLGVTGNLLVVFAPTRFQTSSQPISRNVPLTPSRLRSASLVRGPFRKVATEKDPRVCRKNEARNLSSSFVARESIARTIGLFSVKFFSGTSVTSASRTLIPTVSGKKMYFDNFYYNFLFLSSSAAGRGLYFFPRLNLEILQTLGELPRRARIARSYFRYLGDRSILPARIPAGLAITKENVRGYLDIHDDEKPRCRSIDRDYTAGDPSAALDTSERRKREAKREKGLSKNTHFVRKKIARNNRSCV